MMTSKGKLLLGVLGFSALATACAEKAADMGVSTLSSSAEADAARSTAAAGGAERTTIGDDAVSPGRVSGTNASAAGVGAFSGHPTAGAGAGRVTAGVGASATPGAGGAPAEEGATSASAAASSSAAAGVGASPTSSSVGAAGVGAVSNAGANGIPPAGADAQGSSSAGAMSLPAGSAGQGAAGAGAASQPRTLRVAFLGDSVTETTCTSLLVYDALRKAGHTSFDLVGTKQNQQGCGVDNADRDVEGHSGYLVTEIVGSGPKASELPMWCAADRADIVLMHFGTNDAWNTGTVPIENVVKAFSEVIAQLRQAQPNVALLVAQIIPLEPDGCPDCPGRVRALNDMIPMWAAAESTPESPIYVVDQWTGFDAGSDTNDRIHPNLQGAQKMADKWLAALQAHNIF